MSEFARFTYDAVDFEDQESIAAVYSESTGFWRRTEVTVLESYYTPDYFLSRSTGKGKPEPGLVWKVYWHDDGIRNGHSKVDAAKRHWVEHIRFGFGRNATGLVHIFDSDDNQLTELDARGDFFAHAPGALWLKGGFCKLDASLKTATTPEEFTDNWADVKTGRAGAFVGMRAVLEQVDVEMTPEKVRESTERMREKLRATGMPEDEVMAKRYDPPTNVLVDEVIGWEELTQLAAYDPETITITPEAIEYIREKIAAGVTSPADLGRDALNERSDIHGLVHTALGDISCLAPHGVVWDGENQCLALDE